MTIAEKAKAHAAETIEFSSDPNACYPLDAVREACEFSYNTGAAEALAEQWIDPKDALPEDGEIVLIREHYRSAKSGRFVTHIIEFRYFSKYGFSVEERCHKNLSLRVTHWMRIPPLKGGDKNG